MDWVELIRASRLLAGGQPSQEALRRAVSTAYYAMFHALATSNADLIVGARTPVNQSDWIATYRSLQHYRAENPLHGWPHLFSPQVRNFATVIGDAPIFVKQLYRPTGCRVDFRLRQRMTSTLVIPSVVPRVRLRPRSS